jgi:RND family efflux transporter MFP subunit
MADAGGCASDPSCGSDAIAKGSEDEVELPKSDHAWRTTGRVAVFVALLAGGLVSLYRFGQRPRIETRITAENAARRIEKAPPTVNVVQPVLAPAKAELVLPGETCAFYETTIFARVSGYLRAWLVDIGDRVEKGQLLALIETPELDEQLLEAKAKVEALKADVQLAETQLAFAKITSDRWNAAAPDGAVSQYERDGKNAEYNIARARLQAAKAQLQLGEATVRRLESELSFKRVLAPFKGVITERHIDVGSLITAGSTAATTSLFTIAQSDTIRVFVNVPQAAEPDVSVGMTASVTSPEYAGRVFAGTVDRTATAIDRASRTLRVEVLVPNTDLTLVTGMYVTVRFETVRKHPPFLIEAGSLNMRTGGPQVAVVDRSNRVHFREIAISRDLGTSVEVAEGLRGDEWLTVNISNEIKEGERVRPIRLSWSAASASSPSSKPSVAEGLAHNTKGAVTGGS